MRGYKKDHRREWNTEFDRWMKHVNVNRREAAMLLDIPEQRIRDLQAGWGDGAINGGIVPSFLTRYAMAAIAAGLRPVKMDRERYDLIVRLQEAACLAGLEPWPAGELLTVNPERPLRSRPKPPKQRKRRKPQWSRNGKRILVPFTVPDDVA